MPLVVGLLVVLLGETLQQAFRVQGGSEKQGELKSTTTVTRSIHSTRVMLDAIQKPKSQKVPSKANQSIIQLAKVPIFTSLGSRDQ